MKRFLIWILAAALLLCGCRSSAEATKPGAEPAPTRDAQIQPPQPADPEHPDVPSPDDVSPDGQLIGKADSPEEAEEIAALYGIELVNCQNGLALFRTEEDPKEVILRGEENGWPPLSLNRTLQFY